jgi:hypothetical protein
MLVSVGAEAEVRVSGFAVNFMALGTVSFTVDANIVEGKMADTLSLHSEINVLMDTVQVVKELQHLASTTGQDDGRVVHVSDPAEGLVLCPLQTPFFKVLHEEVGGDGGHRRTRGHAIGLLVELPVTPKETAIFIHIPVS